jgi:DinB superfamily
VSALAEVVTQALPRLRAISEERASRQPASEVWSAKQIVGHLIDSGVNNHARFVRAGAQDSLSLPGYDQNAWMSAGGWQERPWTDLVTLWAAYQTQIVHVIGGLSGPQRAHTLSIGGGEPITLDFVATDYVRHQLHHLAQLWERAEG